MAVLFFALVSTITPEMKVPTEYHYLYNEEITDRVAKELRADRNVLVSHGIMYFIHAGRTLAPLDRVNSLYELSAGHKSDYSSIGSRLETRYYDRIFLLAKGRWLDGNIQEILNRNYRLDEVIDPVAIRYGFKDGFQDDELMGGCFVLSKRED